MDCSRQSDSLKASNLFRVSFRTMAGSQHVLGSRESHVVLPFHDRRSTEFHFPWNFKEMTFSQTHEKETMVLRSRFLKVTRVVCRARNRVRTRKKEKKLLRSIRIIRSPSFKSNKRVFVMKFDLHGLSVKWKRENLRAGY